ncbi:hypothetical protein ACNOYE_08910 [Nannocystaceae bacterium ST9]
MRLPEVEALRFIELYVAALGWCTRQLDPHSKICDGQSFRAASMADKLAARDRVLERPSLIDDYVAANPDRLGPEDLAEIRRWPSFVRDKLIVERDLKQHAVFLKEGDAPVAYAVCSLLDDVVDLIPPLPTMVDAVLLPWRGVIVCDGLLRYFNLHFGPGLRGRMKETYKLAKARGLITTLGEDAPASAAPEKPARAKSAKKSSRQPDVKQPFVGKWRIVEMERWEVDYVDMDGPAFISIEKKGTGDFKFGLVEGELDCRFSSEAGVATVEFSWAGADEGDPVSGRGRAQVEAEVLRGRIFIHQGDDSAFVAERVRR